MHFKKHLSPKSLIGPGKLPGLSRNRAQEVVNGCECDQGEVALYVYF